MSIRRKSLLAPFPSISGRTARVHHPQPALEPRTPPKKMKSHRAQEYMDMVNFLDQETAGCDGGVGSWAFAFGVLNFRDT